VSARWLACAAGLVLLPAACTADPGPGAAPPAVPAEEGAEQKQARESRRRAALEAGARELEAGEELEGESGIYRLRVPAAGWLRLRAEPDRRYPDRDLRLLSDRGAFLDGFAVEPDGRSNEELAIARIESFGPTCALVPVAPGSLDLEVDAYGARCCAGDADGAVMCLYVLAMSCTPRAVFAGAAAQGSQDAAELGRLLESVRCTP
jgi:hypothetical protein